MPRLNVYGCGSPIRLPIAQAMAQGAGADAFIPGPNPDYLGGTSIIWGLIRGAPAVMDATRAAGFDFFQMDNAYFGRERYFRITRNALQITQAGDRDDRRLMANFRETGHRLAPWRTDRPGPIVLCPSSHFLHGYFGTTIEAWTEDVTRRIRAVSDRPILMRPKAFIGIEAQIADAWCVVTHVSAAGLDALRLGIPVVTTAPCAASPLATSLEAIETPYLHGDRIRLFSTLAWGQFTPDEMRSGLAWQVLNGQA